MLERRINLDGRAATADVPRITIGGLRMAALDLEATADFISRRPIRAIASAVRCT
jgi:N-acetylglucosaminyldiphosphoundecaprenol N-acetyl-beta-D-mannosaminyltransferase